MLKSSRSSFAAALLAICACVSIASLVNSAMGDAQGGNNAIAPDPVGGWILNSNPINIPAPARVQMLANLTGTNALLSIPGAITPTGTNGVLVASGTTGNHPAGSIVNTGTSFQLYFTGTNGIVLKSGTITVFP